MSNRGDPNSNKSQLRVADDTQLHSVARSLRDSTNGMYPLMNNMIVSGAGGRGYSLQYPTAGTCHYEALTPTLTKCQNLVP